MTMALAVALVACSGAVGKTGEPGPQGEPGDPAPPAPPANLSPQARSLTFDSMQLREGGDATTVNVASNFYDQDGDDAALVLSFSVAQTERFVDVEHDAGVLTITPVDAGEAVITVTATDGGGLTASATLTVTVVDAGDPMYIGSLSGNTLTFGGRQTIAGSVIESSFDGEELTFSAGTEHTMIVDVDMDNPDDPNEVTITALQTEGTATVTITATDEDGDTISHSIYVEVRASLAPVLSDMMPDPVTLDVGGDSTTVNVASYFDNHGLEDLTYVATADSEAVSLSNVVDGMLTITPESAGEVMVTVTATNTHGSAMRTISVTVTATLPMARGTIPMQTIAAGGSRSIGLDQYFTPGKGSTHDDLTYTPEIVNGTAATALISGGDTLVITAGSTAGSATIRVTATDGDGESAMQDVSVTVTVETRPDPPPANMPPQYKTGKTLSDMYPIQLISTGDPVNTADDVPTSETVLGDAADNMNINLDTYFEDLDGVDSRMTYKVTKTADNPKDTTTTPTKVVLDIHSTPASFVTGRTPTPGLPASGDPPDGEDESERTLVIEPRNLGNATITVEVRDEDGDTDTFTFTVEVVASTANAAPTIADDADIQDQTGDANVIVNDTTNKRLEIGVPRKVIDSSNAEHNDRNRFYDYFRDVNFDNQEAATYNPNERLEITWKYYPAGTTAGINGAVPAADELAPDKVAVDVSVSPKVWREGINDRFSLTLTGIKGTTNNKETEEDNGHMVALIATDSFGESRAVLFRVEVNNPPVAYGPMADTPEKDRETPGGITKFNDLLGTAGEKAYNLDSTVGTPGADNYSPAVFSDADEDELICQFRTSEHNVEETKKLAIVTMNTDKEGELLTTVDNILKVKPNGTRLGNMTVMVKCEDTFGQFSPEASIPVHVTRGLSIQS